MANYWWWLILALVLGVVEMLSGTVYVLLIAVACLVGAAAAWYGAGADVQIALVALMSVGGCLALWRGRRASQAARQAESGAGPVLRDDDNLDIGNQVEVGIWRDDATTQVRYRGSYWTAIPDIGVPRRSGLHDIVRVDGNRLVLRPALPDQATGTDTSSL